MGCYGPGTGRVVIDPVAGSGTTLLAAAQLGRKAYGFEVKREFVRAFNEQIAGRVQTTIFNLGADKRGMEQMAMTSTGVVK